MINMTTECCSRHKSSIRRVGCWLLAAAGAAYGGDATECSRRPSGRLLCGDEGKYRGGA